MRAVVLDHYGDPKSVLTVRDIPAPQPGSGQVLVKMDASPIHPADIAFVQGYYGVRKALPTVAGLEGAGTVVASNAGLYGKWLEGKRVACLAPTDGPGTWAEYMACPAAACAPLGRSVSADFGAMQFVNPLTALSFLARVRRDGHRAFVQTAASSALGRMVARLARRRGVAAVHVVRREEAAAALRTAGEAHVLVSADPEFDGKLKALTTKLGATIAFDAVAGETTERLAAAMPHGGVVVVYGGLSGEAPKLSIGDTIFLGKRIEGFWLPLEVERIGRLGLLRLVAAVQRTGEATLGAPVLARLPFERIGEALDMQPRGTEGKVLLVP